MKKILAFLAILVSLVIPPVMAGELPPPYIPFAATEVPGPNDMDDEASVQAVRALETYLLAKEAARLSKYALPETPITVVDVPAVVMAGLACQGRRHCAVLALYQDQDVIFMRDDLLPKARENILVHELVHWLQHHSGKFSLSSCDDTIKREMEAYHIQNRYVAEVQNDFLFSRPPNMTCSAQEAK